MTFGPEIARAMLEHACAVFPDESCGLVQGGAYRPMPNLAEDPETDFRMEPGALAMPGVEAVVHSHPFGPDCPSQADMAAQIASSLAWGIVVVCADGPRERPVASPPFWFGDQVPRPPLLGRAFRHGVTDCYALCRDWWLAETGELLPDFPRPDRWWAEGGDMLLENFRLAGFEPVPLSQVRRGDGLLFSIPPGKAVDHCAMYLGEGHILHHLPKRFSRSEPLGRWAKHLRLAVRRAGT